MYDENQIQELKEELVSQGALTEEQAKRLPRKYIKKHLPGVIPAAELATKRFAFAWSTIKELNKIFGEDPYVTKQLQDLYEEEIKSIARGALSYPTECGVRTGVGYSKCVGTGRAPNAEEVKAEGDRRHNEKKRLLRKNKKGGGSLGKAEAQQTNSKNKKQ